jgi:hypothetical protein
MPDALPDEIDPALWFPCTDVPGARDYLYASAFHTFTGRMAAYCPSKQVWFRVSAHTIAEESPEATRYWVQGYLAGNLPHPPDRELEGEAVERWAEKARAFFATGTWSDDDDAVGN